MKIKLTGTLVPLRHGKYYEQIIVSLVTNNGTLYPTALVHIDTFWKGKDSDENFLHDKLNAGEVVNVTITIEENKNAS